MRQATTRGVSSLVDVTRGMASIGDSVDKSRLFVDTGLSERYAKHRTKLPVEHVETIVNKLLKRRPGLWVDVGCGPGTSTQRIIGHSDKIIGVDVSETQIEVAKNSIKHDTVTFLTGSSDSIPAEDASVDVITAVQAAHYFDLPAFFKEVDRVLVPGGIVALACYPDPTITTSTTLAAAVNHINHAFLVDYFPSSRKHHLSSHYSTIEFPYPHKLTHVVNISLPMTYPQILELLSTWSGFQNFCEEKGFSTEEGVVVLDKEMSKFLEGKEKDGAHDLMYSCTMVSAHKGEEKS